MTLVVPVNRLLHGVVTGFFCWGRSAGILWCCVLALVCLLLSHSVASAVCATLCAKMHTQHQARLCNRDAVAVMIPLTAVARSLCGPVCGALKEVLLDIIRSVEISDLLACWDSACC
jgi:hypothetical protein